MSREEAKAWLKMLLKDEYAFNSADREAFTLAIKALEQDLDDFARWVATEIFDDMWEYNKDAFAEIACRKLAKLGIVRANGDKWELVEPQESEGEGWSVKIV